MNTENKMKNKLNKLNKSHNKVPPNNSSDLKYFVKNLTIGYHDTNR